MKLNGVIPDGEVIFRDTILSIGISKNVKIQAPKYKWFFSNLVGVNRCN
jgi:hypothetical protein